MFLQELKGVAEAEVRSIDLWNIRFEADRALYLEDDIPAAMHIQELKGKPSLNLDHYALIPTKNFLSPH